MRYMLRVHVSLVELPEEPPAEEHAPGSDPMEGAMKSIGTMAARIFQPGAIAMPIAEPGGLDWSSDDAGRGEVSIPPAKAMASKAFLRVGFLVCSNKVNRRSVAFAVSWTHWLPSMAFPWCSGRTFACSVKELKCQVSTSDVNFTNC